ncbi:RHS repeat domain-containing protein [Sorangium sp. KYC3313]|uniref:RHS repeat domain-containing protein n=1 Tax=Sorangium sp. KYC3313 TaxID=3449740 RepID=UPI003F8A7891
MKPSRLSKTQESWCGSWKMCFDETLISPIHAGQRMPMELKAFQFRRRNGQAGESAVGDQIARPGGTTVRYTPFDLPEHITQGATTIRFGYGGDQQRIRKTTPEKETLYFGDLYERVTDAASGAVEHRYHVHSPERVVAIVTRGGSDDRTRYVHVDHLGSIDALTDEDGDVIERRSYDPFGQRRNPVWGERPPASFPSETTQGFTGHESDDELGLVNMKGRIYDPRIGRFLTTDPIVSIPFFGQSWNPYSYVLNNPLAYIDPGGFQQAPPEDGARSPPPPGAELRWEVLDLAPIGLELRVAPLPKHEARADADTNTTAAKTGGATPPSDVSVLGTSAGFVPEPVLSSAEATSPTSLVGDTLLGAAEGTGELALGLAQSLVLNAMTLGGYGAYQHGRAMWDGYQQDGFLGALNAVNPLYEIGRHGADTALAIDRSDYRAAGSAGVKTILLGAATVYGAGRGLGALAEGSTAAAGAARAASAARELAQHIANVERVPMNFRRTVALVETAEWPTLVAGGASDLSAAQIAAAQKLGLTPVHPMPGVHAEPTAIFGAGKLGLTPTRRVTTSTICTGPGGCTEFIQGIGGRVTGKYTFEF